MAQFDKNKLLLRNNNNVRYEVNMQADQYGNIQGDTATSKTAFGENISVSLTPIIQLDGLYGLDPREFETFVGPSGTATTTDTLMRVTTGNEEGGFGVIRSRRSVRYRPGQGALARFTAKFSEGVAGYTQRAGFFSQEQALQVGFNGTEFGILRQNGGKAHIELLTVTAPSTGGGGNFTITWPGTSGPVNKVITVPATTAAAIAQVIASTFNTGTESAFWIAEASGNKVRFLAKSVGPKASGFTFTDVNSGATATTATLRTGINHTDNWTPQADFNVDTLDGNGPSNIIIDPTKLNIYQINFRWLGVGEMRYAIENPNNGDMIFFHRENYSNRNTDVHTDNPSLKIGYVAASLGGQGSDIVVEGASMLGAIEGVIQVTKLPTAVFSENNENESANTWHHILSLRNNVVYTGKINTREFILKNINAAFTSNSAVTVALILNPLGVASTRLYNSVDDYTSVSYSNTLSVTTISSTERFMYMFEVAGGGSQSINLEDLRIAIPPNNIVSVIVRSTSIITRNAVSMSWIED